MTEVRFTNDGLTLVGDRWDPAEGVPLGVVLLLHGGGQTRHSWKNTGVRLASAGWSAVAMDTRGHGDSSWSPDGDYSLDALIGDLVATVDGIGSPPVLVGASMGGYTSMVAFGEHPGIGRALVLVDIAPRVEPVGSAKISDFMRAGFDGFESLDDVAAAISSYTPQRKRSFNFEGLKKNVRLRDDGKWHWHWDPRVMQRSADEPTRKPPGTPGQSGRALAALAATHEPVMLVRGLHSDIVSDAGVAELRSVVPDLEYVEVANAAHMIAGDDNDVFAANLLDFLSRRVSAPQPDA